MTINELREKRGEIAEKMKAIRGKSKGKHSEEEARELDKLCGRFDELSDQIDAEMDKTADPVLADLLRNNTIGDGNTRPDPAVRGTRRRTASSSPQEFVRDMKTGAKVPVLTRDDSFASAVRNDHQSSEGLDVDSFGKLIRGLATDNWDGASAEKRLASSGLGSSGGFTVQDMLSAQVIDLARNIAAVQRAGARTIPMDTSDVKFAKVTQDPTAYWRGEAQAITPSQPSIGQNILQSKTCAGLVGLTIELIEDSGNIDRIIQQTLAAAIANAMDLAALRGNDALEPKGLRTTDGVHLIDKSSSTMNFDDISTGVEKIAESNGTPNALIWAPKIAGGFDRLKDSEGRFLEGPASFRALQRFTTNQVPANLGSGSDESEVFVGDWSQLYWGVRKTLRVEVFRQGSAGGDDAVGQMLVWIRAYLRGDVFAARSNHFSIVHGVTGVA